jgi:hypothetical protein
MSDIHIPEGQSLSVIPIHRPLMDYRNQFNELEGNKLQELLSAAQVFAERATIHTSDEISFQYMIDYTMIARFDRQLKCAIKMCKMLTEFKSLCENDRISLIKYGLFELFFIRSIINYDTKQQYWRVPLVSFAKLI